MMISKVGTILGPRKSTFVAIWSSKISKKSPKIEEEKKHIDRKPDAKTERPKTEKRKDRGTEGG